VILWRIARSEYADLSGIGAKLYGGRWNTPGTPMVYLAKSLSLAAYENFVHMPRSLQYVAYTALMIEVPDDASMARPDPLPADWRKPRPAASTMNWGTQWAAAGESLLAAVPSTLLPLDVYRHGECNVLLNPAHAHAGAAEVVGSLPFAYDMRVWDKAAAQG
jgi:RES domain-containing protein